MKENGMQMFKLILIALALSHQMSACKPKPVLPGPTQEGLNTFGVKIDGKVWLPTSNFGILGPGRMQSYYDPKRGVLTIIARKSADEVINLSVINARSLGSYRLNSNNALGTVTRYYGKLVDDNYLTFSTGTNSVSIAMLDTVNKVISGSFEVQMKGEKTNTIKNFSQGIFDLKYEN